MSNQMTPKYKEVSEQVEAIVKDSGLSELQKYSLLSSCLAKVAHEHNGNNFAEIKVKLSLVCKTMLDAVEKAEQIFGIFKNIKSK